MDLSYDLDALSAYLRTTDDELKVYIDEGHMSYLPLYLGRADARHALGQDPGLVLQELQNAARVYLSNGTVFLAKWPREAFRRRRLEPLETAMVCGDEALTKKVAKVFSIDPMTLFAGIEPDDVSAEIHSLTPYFKTGDVKDQVDLAGALAALYWLMIGNIASEDAEGYEAARRRATRLLDDHGHLIGGAGSGGVARIRTIHETFAAFRPARPEAVTAGILRHMALARAEHEKAARADPQVLARATGVIDRTALALLAVAAALGVDCGGALAAAGVEARMLAYAKRLGHTVAA